MLCIYSSKSRDFLLPKAPTAATHLKDTPQSSIHQSIFLLFSLPFLLFPFPVLVLVLSTFCTFPSHNYQTIKIAISWVLELKLVYEEQTTWILLQVFSFLPVSPKHAHIHLLLTNQSSHFHFDTVKSFLRKIARNSHFVLKSHYDTPLHKAFHCSPVQSEQNPTFFYGIKSIDISDFRFHYTFPHFLHCSQIHFLPFPLSFQPFSP